MRVRPGASADLAVLRDVGSVVFTCRSHSGRVKRLLVTATPPGHGGGRRPVDVESRAAIFPIRPRRWMAVSWLRSSRSATPGASMAAGDSSE